MQVQLFDKCRQRLRVNRWMMVLLLVAARRQTESDVVRSHAAEFRPQPLDQMPELERPGRIAMQEYNRLS